MDNTLLEIRNLHIMYQGLHPSYAVNGIELSLHRGETLGLVGETGAGKTTTALSILRLLPERTGKVLSGQIYYNGKDLLTLNRKEMRNICGLEISMIFQDPMTSLNPILTVGQQVEESLIFHNSKKLSRVELGKKVDELFEMVGIPAQRKHEYPHEFSGGMKQRVVIAGALACSPNLLIADEPTTALDVTIQAQVLSMIKDLQNQKEMALLLITHDLGVVARMCKNVAVMYAGELVEIGSAEDIFERSRHHPYTVGLLGAVPTMDKLTTRLKPIDGLMPDPADLPTGCKFHPRCPLCREKCRQDSPPLWENGNHKIKCFFAGEM